MRLDDQTGLEMVVRHARGGDGHVARQREVVEHLPAIGALADIARELLAEFEPTQAVNPHPDSPPLGTGAKRQRARDGSLLLWGNRNQQLT